jgi:hypothetical protein
VLWWQRHSDGRQHRSVAVVEAISDRLRGRALPDIYPEVTVHVQIEQAGPPGSDGPIDLFLDHLDDMRRCGQDPALMPADYWKGAASGILRADDLPAFLNYDDPGEERTACNA